MLIDRDCKEITNKTEIRTISRILRFLTNTFTNKYFCVSDAACQQYRRIYPKQKNKLVTLHNGALKNEYDREGARAALGFSNDIIYICCVAFAAKFKGVDILMRAFVSLKDKTNNKLKLCLIGLSPELDITKDVMAIAKEHNLIEDVINFGIIDHVTEVLPAMDIYVQPSRSECLPYALIEAGLASLPSIGSNVGGNPEVILDGQTGYLFESENYRDLTEKLLMLVNDHKLRTKMGEQSKSHKLAEFMMDDKIYTLIDYYREVLDNR
jgi:glycosyltransferase involved in cell wall biosynthesis